MKKRAPIVRLCDFFWCLCGGLCEILGVYSADYVKNRGDYGVDYVKNRGVYSADYVKNRGDYGVDYVKSVIFAHITNESEYG